MKPTIAAKLAQLGDRLDEVNTLLSSENATRDMESYRKLSRERSELEPVVTLYHAWQAVESDISAALEMTGASLTLLKLDDELVELLDHPAHAPGWNGGAFR